MKDNHRNINDFIDDYGFVGHKSLDPASNKFVLDDFGDSSNRTFSVFLAKVVNYIFLFPEQMTYAADPLIQEFNVKKDQMILINGEPVRHPNGEEWTGKAGSMSYDGIVAFVVSAVICNPKFAIGFLWGVFKRGGFAWNSKYNIKGEVKSWALVWERKHLKYAPVADWMGLFAFSWLLRAILVYFYHKFTKSNWFLPIYCLFLVSFYPILVILDVKVIIQSIIQTCTSFFEAPGRWKTTNDINLIHIHAGTMTCIQTPVAWFGRQIYSLRRPAGDDLGRYTNLSHMGVYAALKSYFRNFDRHPPIHLDWQKFLKTFF